MQKAEKNNSKEKLISPMADFCAKELFEEEDIRRYFLSAVLGIPAEEITATRISNPFLRRVRKAEKQGILDILVEKKDGERVNIEIQVAFYDCWEKRSCYYLCKNYVSQLLWGEEYEKLKRTIHISILDYNLLEGTEYHSVFQLRDQKGRAYSDDLEIHILELHKPLKGNRAIDEWIEFFRIREMEELMMLKRKTMNQGILLAIERILAMSGSEVMYYQYEEHLKNIRDQKAIRKHAIKTGLAEGMEKGMLEAKREAILELLEELGSIPEDIQNLIRKESDSIRLKDLHKLAAKVGDFEEFRIRCNK